MDLSEAEQKEMKDFPPGTVPKTSEQFQLRLEIAKKMCKFFNDNDPTMDDEIRAVYEKYPMWGFYVNQDGSCPRRAYGVCFIEKDGQKVEALHMVTAHICFINDVIGGVEASEVRRIDSWSDTNLSIFSMCPNPGIFMDPIGFILPLSQTS